MRNRLLFKALAGLLGAALLIPSARAQQPGEDTVTETHKPMWSPPAKFRRLLEQQQMLKQKIKTRGPVETTPWLSPKGERLVGVVENRMLTKPQLEMRVNLFLQHQSRLDDPAKEEDRRVICESRILADWAQMTALAVLAEKQGFAVTPEEVDQALQKLASQSVQESGKAAAQMQMIGIPEGELRQELRDGIIVEKMMHTRVGQVSDEQLLTLFKAHPDAFLDPTRVKAWQLFQPSGATMTRKQIADAQKEFEKWGKRLRKCKKEADYLKLQSELKGHENVVLSYLDRVASNEPLPAPLLKELFGLEPGETSGVIPTPLGLHMVKVLERTEGHGKFADAKPQIQNYLIEKVKDVMYQTATSKLKVITDASGLNKYRELAKPTTPEAGAADATGIEPDPASAGTDATDAPPMANTARVRPASATAMPRKPAARGLLRNPPPVEDVLARQTAAQPGDGAEAPTATQPAGQALGQRLAAPQNGAVSREPAGDGTPESESDSTLDRLRRNAAGTADSPDRTLGAGAVPNGPSYDMQSSGTLLGARPRLRPDQMHPTLRRRKPQAKPRPLFKDPPPMADVLAKEAHEENMR